MLLLEAGSNGAVLNARIPAACGKLQHTSLDWQEYVEPQPDRACLSYKEGKAYWPRGKVLGGSSVLNYMAYVRGDSNDFESWASITKNPAWGWENVSSVYKRMEDCHAICNEGIDLEFRGLKGPLSVDFKYPRNPIALRFVAAAGSIGFNLVDYNQGCLEHAVSIHQTTTREGVRCSAADAYIWPVIGARPNLSVVLNAEVSKIQFDTSRPTMPVASGVVVKVGTENSKKKEIVVKAKKEVIVSSSAVGSPKLLLLSGIGPAAELKAMNIPCIRDSPDVGLNLTDHVCVPVFARAHPKAKDIGSINRSNSETLSSLYWWLFSGVGNLASSAYDASCFFSTGRSPDYPFPDIQIGERPSTD